MNLSILNKNISTFIICLFFLYGCKSDHKIEYYPNGKIKSSYSIGDGIKNGLGIKYYNNGIIKYLCTYKNDLIDGMAISYDSLGHLIKAQTWKNGKLNGSFQTYYSNKNIKEIYFLENDKMKGTYLFFDSIGEIQEKKEYIIHNGESELNQYIVYNQLGKIDTKKSNYFTLYSEKDTINFGDKYKLKINLDAPIFDYMQVIIGKYSEEFNLLEETSNDTVLGNNHLAVISIDSKKKGLNKFSVVIDNYSLTNADDNTSNKYKSRYMFFSKSFYVK